MEKSSKKTPRITDKKIFRAKVVDVLDGDTLEITFNIGNCCFPIIRKFTLRLEGIDAPETRTRNPDEKKAGLESKEYLISLLMNEYITVHLSDKPEKFGRLLGTVFYNNTNICLKMIEKGLAVEYQGKRKK